jgi:hypothetical protein
MEVFEADGIDQPQAERDTGAFIRGEVGLPPDRPYLDIRSQRLQLAEREALVAVGIGKAPGEVHALGGAPGVTHRVALADEPVKRDDRWLGCRPRHLGRGRSEQREQARCEPGSPAPARSLHQCVRRS